MLTSHWSILSVLSADGSLRSILIGGNAGGHEEEDDDDDEWVEPGKKEMRRRRDKNSPRRNKSLKFKVRGNSLQSPTNAS